VADLTMLSCVARNAPQSRVWCYMIVGDRIREIREEKKLCQVDLASRARLVRSYLAQVEDGKTVPDVETLERIASALEVPLYKLFYEGEESPTLPNLTGRQTAGDVVGDKRPKFRK
jgi:transcriptional regulator with XRE-family HTH domain